MKKLRKGQSLFDFLEWIATEKKIETNQSHRLADTFYLPNDQMDRYLKEYKKLNPHADL